MRSDTTLHRGRSSRGMRRGKVALALIATAALCLGPTALAYADEAAPETSATASSATDTAVGAATEAPAAAPAADPAPVAAAEPAPEVTPAADPAPAEPASEPASEPAVKSSAPAQSAKTQSVQAKSAPVKNGAGDNNSNKNDKIGICHATGAAGKWVYNEPNKNGTVSGHAGHQGGRDIIPPFTYQEDGQTKQFPGQNWNTAGQAVYNNSCTTPGETNPTDPTDPTDPEPSTTNPSVALTTDGCYLQSASAGLTAHLSDLVDGESYTVVLTLNGVQKGKTQTVVGDSGGVAAVNFSVTAVGTYVVTVTGPGAASATSSSAVADCPPDEETPISPSITVGSEQECLVEGSSAGFTVIANLSDLVVGDTYTVDIAGAETQSTEITATAETATVSFQVYTPGLYTERVTGPGYEPAWAETEIVVTACDIVVPCETGNGNEAVGETVAVDAPRILRGVFGEGENDTVTLDSAGNVVFGLASAADENSGDECGESPAITVSVGECVVKGSESAAMAVFQATGLMEGESYDISVTGPSGYVWTGTIVGKADGTGSTSAGVGAPGVYTATIAGGDAIEFVSAVSCATTTPTEPNPEPEPEPGVKTPTAKPASTPTATDPEPEALAVTGSTGTTPFLWMGAAALMAAAGLMAAPKLARRIKR